MRRPMTTAVLLGVVLTLLAGCGKQGCTALGGVSSIRIQVPAAIQKLTKTLRVELCQGSRCESVNFASRATEPNGFVSEGISLEGDAYTVDVDLLGTKWKAGTESGLTILGFTAKGRTVLRHTEQFEFDGYYPNGEDCDDEPFLRYGTSVGGEDLVG